MAPCISRGFELAEVVVRAIHAIHPESRPGSAALEKTDPQPRKLVEDAMIDHARERDDQRKRVAHAVDRHEGFKGVEPHAVMAAAVHG